MHKAEDLAYWYLRLNGFLTIPNFILHPDRRGSQRTDADIVGLRFPFRREFEAEGVDDSKIRFSESNPTLVFAEVKTGVISINDAWSDPTKKNINKALQSVGLFDSEELAQAANALYDSGRFDGHCYYCSLLFIGNRDTGQAPPKYSGVPRILWDDIIKFIHSRFHRYLELKRNNHQWDDAGKELFHLAGKHISISDFEAEVRERFSLPAVQHSFHRT